MKKKLTTEDIIKLNNSAFKKASKKNKIIMVAMDVLDRIKSKQYFAQSGAWMRIADQNVSDSESFQKSIIESNVTCECCALGGIMSSCVVFKNNVTVEEAESTINFSNVFDGDDRLEVVKLFGLDQLSMIELAFEVGGGYFYSNDIEWEDTDGSEPFDAKIAKKCINFGKKFRSNKNRMIAIMKNIIDNNGKFVP